MALEFYKRRFRKPGKKMQYALAISALLLALAILVVWIIIGQKLDASKSESSADSTLSTAPVDPLTAEDEGRLLLIINGEKHHRFVLVHTDPANSTIRVTTISENAITEENQTLSELYLKKGGAYVTKLIGKKVKSDVRYYAAVSAEDAEGWFTHLGDELTVKLDGEITLSDGPDKTVTLPAGENAVKPEQALALLCSDDSTDKAAAEVIAAMLRQHLRAGRNFSADFTYLSNIAQTGLRIDNYNKYADNLAYLAEKNTNGACTFLVQTI